MSDKINNNKNEKEKIYEINEISKENNNIYNNNNYFVNKVQKPIFLTNVSPNINIIDYKMKLKEIKGLKERKNSLIKKINSVRNKREEMNEISFNNISKSNVNINIINNNKKDLNSLEKNLIDKLNEIKEQIKAIDKNDNDNNNLILRNENKIKLIKKNVKFDESSIKEQLLNYNKERLREIENKYLNEQKEILNRENDLNIEKELNLRIRKEEEIELRIKRKLENEKKMEDLRKDLNKIFSSNKNNNNNNLYQKMEKNFIERENKLIQDARTEKKLKNFFYKQNLNLENEKLDFYINKENNERRAKEQTEYMKKLWHSRSMMLKPYQLITNNNNNKINQNEEKITKIENSEKKDRKQYSKEKVKLPPINEKLKQESEWRKIDIKNLEGKERVNYVKKKYMQKGIKMLNVIQNLDFGKKYILEKKKNRNLSDVKQKEKKIDDISFSKANRITNFKLKKIIIKNNKLARSNINKKRAKDPKEINYLKDLKIKKKEYHKWENYFSKKEENKLDNEGLLNISKNIERLDEKIKMNRELMKINGGYENNEKLGKEVNNCLIDSIKGKLAILDALSFNKEDKEDD